MSKKNDRTYWYAYLDINDLLKAKSQDNVYKVIDSTGTDDLQTLQRVSEAFTVLNNPNSLNVVVIPINLGISNQGTWQGLHWVGLVIKKTETSFKAFYTDSLATPIEKSFSTSDGATFCTLKQILINHGVPENNIIESNVNLPAQQSNGYDCGPWTVFNLDSLARTENLTNVSDNEIIAQRNSLSPDPLELLLEGQPNKAFESMKIADNTSSVLDKDEAKCKDISKLEEMFKAIKLYEQGNLDLQSALIKIGDLAGGTNGIFFNDKHDKDSYYIRNKYGYIQRNHENQINKDGIYFEKLYHLKIILEYKDFIIPTKSLDLILKPTDFHSDFKSKEDILKRDLLNLKQKIGFILNQEKDFIQTNGLLVEIETLGSKHVNYLNIPNIIDFSKYHYEQMILKRIKKELEEFEDMDFSISEDRYYFARKFTIIGELLHEFTEGKKIEKEDSLLQAFKNLDHIRSTLIHCHKKVYLGSKDKEEEKDINQIIRESLKNLNTIIIIDPNNANNLQVNYTDEKTAKSLEENSKKLKKILEGTNSITEINEPRANKILEQNQTDIKTDKEIEKEKLHNKIKSLIVQASKAIETAEQSTPSQKKSKLSIDDFLSKLNKQYQVSLGKLDVSEQQGYPSILTKKEIADFSIFTKEITGKAQQEKKQQKEKCKLEKNQSKELESASKITKTIDKINKEIDYLKKVEQLENISMKKDYIIQHIVSIIGQYVKDIEDSDTTKFIPTISSRISEEASISAKSARNQGLAHNIFSFDSGTLEQRVKNDILPAHEHFQSIFTIYKHFHRNVPISVIILHQLGYSFCKLCLYREAIKYFKQTVERIETYPKEIDEIKLSSMGITQEHGNVKVIDLDQVLFGIENYNFIAQKNLAKTYLLAGDYNEAYKVLELITEKIDFSSTILASEDFRAGIAEIFSNIASYFVSQGSYKEATKCCEQASLILPNDLIIKINLASLYRKLNQHDKETAILEFIGRISNLDPIVKLGYLECYADSLLDNLEKHEAIKKVDKCIAEMENTLESNIDIFKQAYSDRYLLIQLTSIKLRINIIYEKAILATKTQVHYNFSDLQLELEKLEEQCNGIISSLNPALKHDEKLTNLYGALTCCFASMINNQNVDSNNEQKNLEKAQNYFDKASIAAHSFQEILDTAADRLAIAYSNYSLLHIKDKETEKRIKYLEKALKIQEEHGIDKSITLSNLGFEYCNLGERFAESCKFEDAVSNYNKAISYFIALNTVTKECLDGLAMSYEGVGFLRYDIELMQKAMSYYEKVIELGTPQEEIMKAQQQCKQKISSMKNMFKLIQDKLDILPINAIVMGVVFGSELESYALSFYLKKLSIHFEVRDKKCIIFLEDKSKVEEFKSHIKQELERFCNISINTQESLLPVKSMSTSKKDLLDEQLSKQETLVEKEIITQFRKFDKKISKGCNNAEIEITTKEIEKTVLEHYCKTQLSINSDGLAFNNGTCWISLNKKSMEILRNKLSSQNHEGQGRADYEDSSYWNQYSKEGMEELLKLRLESVKAGNIEVIMPNYVWDDSFYVAEKLINEITSNLRIHDKLLIPLNLYSKHWVGIAIDRSDNGINIYYMDSEQNGIPSLLNEQLLKQITTAYSNFKVSLIETKLELQKCNNCGPEVIENFIAYLTNGNRVLQEDAISLHSQLLEKALLSLSDDISLDSINLLGNS